MKRKISTLKKEILLENSLYLKFLTNQGLEESLMEKEWSFFENNLTKITFENQTGKPMQILNWLVNFKNLKEIVVISQNEIIVSEKLKIKLIEKGISLNVKKEDEQELSAYN